MKNIQTCILTTIFLAGLFCRRLESKDEKRQTVCEYLKDYARKGGKLFVGKSKSIQCFSGFTTSSQANIEYEIFPDLGFFRIRPFNPHSNKEARWLGITMRFPRIDKRTNYLTKDLSNKLLLVGSGLIKSDATNYGPLLVIKNENYKTYEFPIWIEPFAGRRKTDLLLVGAVEKIEDYFVRDSGKWFSVMEVSP